MRTKLIGFDFGNEDKCCAVYGYRKSDGTLVITDTVYGISGSKKDQTVDVVDLIIGKALNQFNKKCIKLLKTNYGKNKSNTTKR